MARPYGIPCPHQSGVFHASTLVVEPRPGDRFMRKYVFPESVGCVECRTRESLAETYLAVPVKEGQSYLDALLEAVQRFGGPLHALAVAAAQGGSLGSVPVCAPVFLGSAELRTGRDAEGRGEDRLGVSNQVAP